MRFNKNISKLEKYKYLKNQEEVFKFEREIANIINIKSPECIPILMDYLDDTCEFPEVMYSIIHAIEFFPDELYIPQVIKYSPVIISNSPFWLDCLYNRIFNSRDAVEVFRKNMFLISKSDLLKIFSLMEKMSPHHCELIAELRQELEIHKEGY